MSKLSEKIRAVDDGSAESYEVPEWDVVVEIRSMTARARASFVAEIAGTGGDLTEANDPNRIMGMWWHVISQTCFDPDTGDLAFEPDDVEWLFEKNARVVNDLANQCMEASGLTEEAQADMGKDSSGLLIDEDGELLSVGSTSG